MTDLSHLASRLRFVLVRTSHPGNIGSAARAIRTMGFERLELVTPARFPDREANALAAGGSVVTKSVEPGVIVAGNPAAPVGQRQPPAS